jgi:ComF family protein
MFGTRRSIVNRWRQFRLTGHRSLARLLAATLFPPDCCLCGFPGASLDLDLCQFCHGDLPWDTGFPGALTALRYEYPVDEMVRRLKYRGDVAMARVLGVLLAEVAAARAAPLPRLLVPVPLHPARLRERGFNQAAAIARYAGRMLDIPSAPHALVRTRDTTSQTFLGVIERMQNLRGAFAARSVAARHRLLEASHVAIVDDVMTTGSTLGEARRQLLAAGVERVETWAVARALQASPAFLSASSGGPSNLSSDTLPL